MKICIEINRKTQPIFLYVALLVAVIFFSNKYNIVIFSANTSPLCVIEQNLVGKSTILLPWTCSAKEIMNFKCSITMIRTSGLV